uniref:Uncharacterized protein n=1 Tax=Rhizophora mucronata TaxID=61149 RepID=A0A2P2NFA6_RHIMU
MLPGNTPPSPASRAAPPRAPAGMGCTFHTLKCNEEGLNQAHPRTSLA